LRVPFFVVCANFNIDWNSLFFQSFLWEFVTVTIQAAVVVYCSFSRYNKKGLFFDYRIEGG